MQTNEGPPFLSGEEETWLVAPQDAGIRFDAFMQTAMLGVSRARIQRWISDGLLKLDGSASKPGVRLRCGQVVTFEGAVMVEPLDLQPEALTLDVVYEDTDLIVVNKQAGMVVHPSAGHASGTLVHGLLHHCRGQLSGIGGVARPGIVHRLDKDTSGLIVAAKTDVAHVSLAQQIASKRARRVYWAVVGGHLPTASGRVDAPIARHGVHRQKMAVVQGGKPAATRWEVLESFRSFDWVACALETGRTHQIRVHLSFIGHPIVGDPLYGGDRSLPVKLTGQALHARELSFEHPRNGQALVFEAAPPAAFSKLLSYLNAGRA